MFPGPHVPPAKPMEPERSIHSIYKKQQICKMPRPQAPRWGGPWEAKEVWRVGWAPLLTLQELGARLGPRLCGGDGLGLWLSGLCGEMDPP